MKSSTVQSPSEAPTSAAKRKIEHPEPADLLQYLPLYKVVICSPCKYAIQPQAIARHLKEIHHIHRSHRRPFMQHVSKLSLNDAETVIETKIHEFPVPLLPVQDGLVCESDGCGHLCVSTKRMRTHWLEEHGRSGQAFLDWQPVKIQTFFRGNLLRYFTNPKVTSSGGKEIPHCDFKGADGYGKSKVYCPSLVERNSFLTDVHRMTLKLTIYHYHPPSNRYHTPHLTPPILTSSPTTSLQPLSASQPRLPPPSGNIMSPTSQPSTPSSCMASSPSQPSTSPTSPVAPNPPS